MTKTNAMRILDRNKITYQVHDYQKSGSISAIDVAEYLNEDIERVFKTLVTIGKSRNNYVYVIPASKELNLKKAAQCAGEKNIEMIHQKELFPLTGYVHGGCSPIGMKKTFSTFIDKSALHHQTIFISGGKIGLQIEIKPTDLEKITNCIYVDLV